MAESKKTGEIKDFWSNRADLGIAAGSQDIILKKLEIEAILAYAGDGMHILDIGCGNGITAIEIARRYRADIVGIDFAEPMVVAATKLAAAERFKGSLKFQVGDVSDLSPDMGKFDMIYTERTLINLPDWSTQSKAIADISKLLVESGRYVMCESSQDGLDSINSLRQKLGLNLITPPWHNRYLKDAEVAKLAIPGIKLEEVRDFSSTYYFLSRVVNVWMAAREGKEPEYDAPVNQLALELPAFGNIGQTRIWAWRKTKGRRTSGALRR